MEAAAVVGRNVLACAEAPAPLAAAAMEILNPALTTRLVAWARRRCAVASSGGTDSFARRVVAMASALESSSGGEMLVTALDAVLEVDDDVY